MHIHIHINISKVRRKIWRKIFFILIYTKKINSLQIFVPIQPQTSFFCSLKYNTISTETSHKYSGHLHVFMK
jgi:hypothetical protein